MKIKDLIREKFAKIIIILLIILALILACSLLFKNKNAKVDTTYIVQKLEKSSELTTSKLTYEGFSKYIDEGYSFINKQDFFMQYSAEVRAGVDVKDIKVEVGSIFNTITITIPKAKILEVKILPESIQYYNEGLALFNFDSKEDAAKAQKLAEEDAKEKVANMGILEMADSQAEALIKGLVQDVIPEGYKLKIKVEK